MINYFLIIIYILSIFSIFILPLYTDIKRDRVIALSFIPILLIALIAFISMLGSYLWGDMPVGKVFLLSFFIFLQFVIFGYLMMFPILILVAFIVEYLRIYYHYKPIKLALLSGVIASFIVGITFSTWKFVWAALISGFLSVLIQYYLTEYKKVK